MLSGEIVKVIFGKGNRNMAFRVLQLSKKFYQRKEKNMLKEKVAVITGASRGIGKEIALTFAREGATVIVNYNGSKDAAEEVVAAIINENGKAEAYQCDIADFQKTAEMMDYIIKKYKRVDILVNNAGITKDNLLLKMSEEDFDRVIDTNLKGAFQCTKHVAKQMIKQRSGRIINISSVCGIIGNAGQANYCAAKAGMIGLTKSAARELATRGITVNAIAPGFIETDMTDVLSDTIKDEILTQIPMKRLGSVKDIAQMAAFLASEKASYITGQVININGGMAM